MNSQTEEQLVEYYFMYRSLVNLHRKFNFGNAPRTSEGFTEAICCHLFGFKKALDVEREYDLIDPKTNTRIEVKATTDEHGSTRMNPNSIFDKLYWLNFRLDIDVLHVCEKDFSLFTDFREKNKMKERANIILSKYGNSNASYYRFNKLSKIIEPISFETYLKHIQKKKAS